jgi:uncharacterized membrane protein required for colicin V production
MKFSPIDLLFLLGFGLAGFLGHRGGMTKKLFNLLIIVVGVALGAKLMKTVGSFFSEPGILKEGPAVAVGFAIIFLLVIVPSMILYHRFGKTGLGKTSTSVVGIVLGVVEGALLMSFLMLGLALMDVPDNDTRQESLFYLPVTQLVPRTLEVLQGYLPGARELRDEIARQLKEGELPKSVPSPGKQP